jgi:hypothetical protein
MKKETKVKIRKIEHLDDANYKSNSASDQEAGYMTEGIPDNYEVEGVLVEDVKVGSCIELHRNKRNGVSAIGYFRTSQIKAISDNIAKTQNSYYIIEEI